jgi:hypothetical protein
MLGRARCHVRVVMLDADPPLGAEMGRGVLRREIGRVEVVDGAPGLEREQALQVGEALLERAVRREVLQVADVGRDVSART